MQRRPIVLRFLSLALLGVAVAMPAQIMLIYGHDFNEFSAVLSKLTIFNWLVIFGCVACAYAVNRASPHSAKAMGLLTLVVAANNFFVGYYAVDYSPWTALVSAVGFSALNLPLYRPDVRQLLKHPRMRWWLNSRRYRMAVPVVIGCSRRSPVRAETFDLSETGVFIPFKETHLRPGDQLSLRLTFGTFSQMRCEGKVVRRTESRGNYPAGVGVEFTDVGWRLKRQLRRHFRGINA